MKNEKQLRNEIIQLTSEYFSEFHVEKPFVPGQDYVRYSGRVYDQEEGKSLINASLDFWLTAGDYAKKLEKKLASKLSIFKSSFSNKINSFMTS